MSAHGSSRALHTPAQADPAEVKSLEELAKKYGLAPPDELAGPQTGQAYLDYGRPVVLADSSARSRDPSSLAARWAKALQPTRR